MKHSNIHNYERISANILYIISILKLYFKFRKVYSNSNQAFIGFLKNNETKVIFKNKKYSTLSARVISLVAFLHNKEIELDYKNNKIIIEKKQDLFQKKKK